MFKQKQFPVEIAVNSAGHFITNQSGAIKVQIYLILSDSAILPII